jgi:integrase
MGTVFPYKGRWRFKFKDAAGEWRKVTSKAHTKAEARSEMHEKELEVERQNLGLAPRAINPERWTVADLMRWWLDTYSRHQAAHESNEGTVRCHILGAAISAKLVEHVRPGDVEQLLQSKEGQVAPGTINHIRQFFVRAFNRARKAGKWHGPNPAEDVDTRRVPEPIVNILAPEEVFPFFAALAPDQRPVFAAAIFTGFRKGELCGVRKDDVALVRRLVMARRSYERPFPKSKRQRVVAIPEEFAPFVAYALRATKGPWLFPDENGAMRNKTWQPEDVARRALKRAGIVTGYTHVCRRKTCRFSEEREDAEIWPVPALRVQALAEGERPGDPVPRSPAHVRERAPHARRAARVGAEAARPLGSEDHRAQIRAPAPGLHEVRGRSAAVRDRPARAASSPPHPAPLPPLRGREGKEWTDSPAFAGVPSVPSIPLVSAADARKTKAGTPPVSREVPASLLAGCRGLEPLASGVTGRRYNRLN